MGSKQTIRIARGLTVLGLACAPLGAHALPPININDLGAGAAADASQAGRIRDPNMVLANPKFNACVNGPAPGVTPTDADFDCLQEDAASPAVQASGNWNDRLFGSGENSAEITGIYDANGKRVADLGGQFGPGREFELRAKMLFKCPEGQSRSFGSRPGKPAGTYCARAGSMQTWIALKEKYSPPGKMKVKFQDFIVGPAGFTPAPDVGMSTVLATKNEGGKCDPGWVMTGVNQFGERQCEKLPEPPKDECRTVSDIVSSEVVGPLAFTKAVCNDKEVVRTGGGRCNVGGIAYSGPLNNYDRNWRVDCLDPAATSVTFTATCCVAPGPHKGYQGGSCEKVNNSGNNVVYDSNDSHQWPKSRGSGASGNTRAGFWQENVGISKNGGVFTYPRLKHNGMSKKFTDVCGARGGARTLEILSSSCSVEIMGSRKPLDYNPGGGGNLKGDHCGGSGHSAVAIWHTSETFCNSGMSADPSNGAWQCNGFNNNHLPPVVIPANTCSVVKNGDGSIDATVNGDFLIDESIFPNSSAGDSKYDPFKSFSDCVAISTVRFKADYTAQCCSGGRDL